MTHLSLVLDLCRPTHINQVSAVIVMLVLLLLTEFFYYIPQAALGAIIEVALINLIELKASSGARSEGSTLGLVLLLTRPPSDSSAAALYA